MSETVTILFTDLVESTDLMSRTGDASAMTIFQAHRRVLSEAAQAHRGREVKWTGDGLMVSFPSCGDAVRCAVSMQRVVREPVDGERLQIRVGISVGEAIEDEDDYLGTSVVVARRLCDSATGGQILCTDLVVGLLSGQRGFTFSEHGSLQLKGIPGSTKAFEVVYDTSPRRATSRPPYVGRGTELGSLLRFAESARTGSGGVALIRGEPGIGKTRMAEEVVASFRESGGRAMWGHCAEGGWSPPFAPFVQIVEGFRHAMPDSAIGRALDGLGSLTTRSTESELAPDEERYRLLEGTVHLLRTASAVQPLLLVLDDLQWADPSTVAMMRHVVPRVGGSPVMLLCTYRESEVTRDTALFAMLQELPRSSDVHYVDLQGLDVDAVGRLLSVLAEQDVAPELVRTITAQTGGNPFFVRELLMSLIDDGTLRQSPDGTWVAGGDLGATLIPQAVRNVLAKRLGRLSEDAGAMLRAASLFDAAFALRVAGSIADLSEETALDALDEVLGAGIVQPGEDFDTYRFAHALLRTASYDDMSPSRRARLHLRAAHALIAALPASPSVAAHAQIAEHFHLSGSLDGTDAGVEHAMAAGDHAAAAGSFIEAERFFTIALDLCPDDDPRRGDIEAALALTLAWKLEWDACVELALRATETLKQYRGADAAADFLARASATLATAGSDIHDWALAPVGLELIGDRRDLSWAILAYAEMRRLDAADPASPGIDVSSPLRLELDHVSRQYMRPGTRPAWTYPLRMLAYLPTIAFTSRRDVIEELAATEENPEFIQSYLGDLRRSLELYERDRVEYARTGRVTWGALAAVNASRAAVALGDIAHGTELLQEAWDLVSTIPRGNYFVIQVASAQEELTATLDDDWRDFGQLLGVDVDTPDVVGIIRTTFSDSASRAFLATIYAVGARLMARIDRRDAAGSLLEQIIRPIQKAAPWAINLPRVIAMAAETAWRIGDPTHAAVIEEAAREKWLEPDFGYPSIDINLSLAHITAAQGRHEEASEWFTKARESLDLAGARPLRAITDLDEAQMLLGLDRRSDAMPLIDAAEAAFTAIGMPGWLTRAQRLRNA